MNNAPGLQYTFHNRRIVIRDVILKDERGVGVPTPGLGLFIFDRNRQSLERARIGASSRVSRFCFLRSFQSIIEELIGESAYRRFHRFRPINRRLHQFDRGEFTAAKLRKRIAR